MPIAAARPGRSLLIATALLGWVLTPYASAGLTSSVSAVSGWPDQARHDAAVTAAQAVIDRYNAYGDFGNSSVWIHYDAGIPTAQASCQGSIGFGGTYPAQRVMQHELAHYLCLPSGNWDALMSGGKWSGPSADQQVRQFDGEEAELHGDSIHFWPYGLNYDSEGDAINMQRQVAMVYAMRADLGIGPAGPASTATSVSAISDDAPGTSCFHYADGWSDDHFPHEGADYSSGDHKLFTPASANSFTFYGDSLTINNTAPDNGLCYAGAGTSSIIFIENLVLDGGSLHHLGGIDDLFQLDGNLRVAGSSSIRAKQGNITILAPVSGSGDLTIAPTDAPGEANRYLTLASADNTFTGNLINQARFELANLANLRFLIGDDGVNNAISGATAQATVLSGVLEIDVSGASTDPYASWALVTAANVTFGRRFSVAGFDANDTTWSNGDYTFDETTGLLTLVTTWKTNNGGLWSHAANWTAGVPAFNGDARLGILPSTAVTIDLDVPVSLNRLTFDHSDPFTLAGANSLTLTGAAELIARTGDHEIAVPITGTAGLTKRGSGTVALSAANSYSGDTTIAEGTLSMIGSGSIANAATINVQPGATFDVSGLASGFTLGGGQTLNNNNSNTTVVGDVTAANGSTIAGTGTFEGDVNVQGGATLQIGGTGLPSGAAFDLVDDLESYTAGLVRDVASPPWTAHMNTMYAAIQDDGSGQNNTLAFGWADDFRGASRTLPADTQIADGELATVFFRFNCLTDAPNHNLGLGDKADTNGVSFSDFEAQIRLSADSDPSAGSYGLDARGGGSFVDLIDSLTTNTWYNVWLVVDQGADVFDVYLNTGLADATAIHKLNAAPLPFRSGTADPLNTFLALAGPSPLTYAVRIDSLHSFAGVNTANPLSAGGGAQYAPEVLTVNGNVTLEADSVVAFDIASSDVNDRLNVTGTLTAGGTLELVLDPSAPPPQAGDTFDLIDASSILGTFESLPTGALDAGLGWDVSQLCAEGVVSVVDVDGELSDFIACLAGPEMEPPPACASEDLDTDGDVDLRDYALLQTMPPTEP